MTTLATRARARLLAVDGVVESGGIFTDGDAYWVNGKEIAHFHGDAEMELRLTRAVIGEQRPRLRADPRIELRQDASDWIKIHLRNVDDLALLGELAGLAAAAHRAAPGATPAPPPVGAARTSPPFPPTGQVMNKSELLAAIRRDRATLDALVSSLSEAQLAAREPKAGWAVQDHLSHLAAWEQMIVAHLRDGSDAEVAGMDPAAYATATLDDLNDRLYRRSRDRALADTLREFAEAHRAIVSFIAEMPEERLATPYWDDDPPARTVLDKIAGDTYLHYVEHAGWIRELIRRTAEAR